MKQAVVTAKLGMPNRGEANAKHIVVRNGPANQDRNPALHQRDVQARADVSKHPIAEKLKPPRRAGIKAALEILDQVRNCAFPRYLVHLVLGPSDRTSVMLRFALLRIRYLPMGRAARPTNQYTGMVGSRDRRWTLKGRRISDKHGGHAKEVLSGASVCEVPATAHMRRALERNLC
jgi:hypothetical protein